MLASPREVHRTLRYVLLNARHHVAKRRASAGARVQLDPASSSRWFDGWKPKTVGTEHAPSAASRPPVARARTWLLAVG